MNWTDSGGNLWLFGGIGYDLTAGSRGDEPLNDLWKYSNGQWTWEGDRTSVLEPRPMARKGS